MTYQAFMPYWAKEDKCFQEEQIEVQDRAGKKSFKPWVHDKSVPQRTYEEFLKVIVNPDSNDYYQARDNRGAVIKGTTAKHIVTHIIRIKRKDGTEFLYSNGRIEGYDAFGNRVHRNCAKPEVWTRTVFDHQRIYDQRTNSTKMRTIGTLGTETVYEMPYNEKNLGDLVALRANDTDIVFSVKDEASDKAVEVKKENNITKTLERFKMPFDHLFESKYISPQQRAELRQMAIDAGIIGPSTSMPLGPGPTDNNNTGPPPPKGTYS